MPQTPLTAKNVRGVTTESWSSIEDLASYIAAEVGAIL
jgi:hypothetical protein